MEEAGDLYRKISFCYNKSYNLPKCYGFFSLVVGGLVEHGRSIIALYGEEALRSLMKEMVKENIDLSEQEIECFGHYIYRKVRCFTARLSLL